LDHGEGEGDLDLEGLLYSGQKGGQYIFFRDFLFFAT